MFRGTRWGMLIGAGAALGMVFHTMRQRAARARDAAVRQDDQVTQESDDSFPASDAPSHTPTSGSHVTN